MIYRFVQLSDIHFGQEREGTRMVHEDVRSMLLKDAAELAQIRGEAHLVIVVGDTAFAGKEIEYKEAGVWLDQLTKAVQCGETDVRVVPGNHDCDWSQINWVARTVHSTIRNGTPKSAYANLAEMAKDPEDTNPLLPKLKAYRNFAAGYESDLTSATHPFWTKDFPLADGLVLRFVGMNSVQVCDKEDSPGNMILGNTQYILPDEPHLVYIAILHHPLDWYKDKAEARQYLHNRARIIMVGHEHIPTLSKATDVLKNERLEIYSGATNPPESGDLYLYTYNWIEMTLCERLGAHILSVNIFPRVWVPERVRFAADTQRLAGQESAEFEIACPRLKPAAPFAAVRARSSETAAGSAVTATRDAPNNPSIGEIMATDDQADMAKLKFLFWRYLDWQQRLKVLVQADALPPSADRPVPQTMERLALENARETGKLGAIWDAMMEHVPDAKKQKNPFNKARS